MITDLGSDIPNTLRKGIVLKNRDSERLLPFSIFKGALLMSCVIFKRHITSIGILLVYYYLSVFVYGKTQKDLVRCFSARVQTHASRILLFKREPIVIRRKVFHQHYW